MAEILISECILQLKALLKPVTEDFDFEAREIIKQVLTQKGVDFLSCKTLCQKDFDKMLEFAERRTFGEPLQYIFGEWEFYGYNFTVGDGVLIPRPETEFLVELGAKHLNKNANGFFADLCSGSGCIAISLCKQTGCNGFAVELSEKAFAYLKKNTEKNNVANQLTAIDGDIFDEKTIDFLPQLDCILSNPPYLTQKDMGELQPEVLCEPEMALFGGADGLDYYRKIFEKYKEKLKVGGMFAVEIGMGQEKEVGEFMAKSGIEPLFLKDYAGIIRVVYGYKK